MTKSSKTVPVGQKAKSAPPNAVAQTAGPGSASAKPNESNSKLGGVEAPKRSGVPSKAARASRSSIVVGEVSLPDDYRPSESEPFMNGLQKAYFRRKLQTWREDILRQTRETLEGLTAETVQYPDLADRATSETDRSLELRARDRQRKLIAKIDAALARIEDGTYGYCEDTGEPIGLRRLEARPIATLSLEAQERHERRERVHRDD